MATMRKRPLKKAAARTAAAVLATAVLALGACDTGGGGRSVITTAAEWNDAITRIKSGGDGEHYELTIAGTIPVAPTAPDASTFIGSEHPIITLTGSGVLSLTAPGAIFVLFGETLIMDGDITLEGRDNNTTPLAVVYDGAVLEMKRGAISGNTSAAGNTAVQGGGVNVQSGGVFTMSGGNISGNTAVQGGGVYVRAGGSFTLSGGEISGNSGSGAAAGFDGGGGVYVAHGGSFTMSGGNISGNSGVLYGGGVYVVAFDSGSFGFTMTGGEISGNTAARGGGVYVVNDGSFSKSGGIIAGDTNRDPDDGNRTDNTATSAEGDGNWGHAVYYHKNDSSKYYCSAALGAADAISTASVPGSGTGGNWTKK
jgi:hypothetical protein